jgi:hypothetical protein
LISTRSERSWSIEKVLPRQQDLARALRRVEAARSSGSRPGRSRPVTSTAVR